MNFIEEFKRFENWLLVHPNVSPSARLVWHALLHYNNLCGWKQEFDLSMSALKLSTGLSAPTIRKAREQLRLMGRIAYRKGSMDHSAVYRLNPIANFGAVSAVKERATDVTTGKDSAMESTEESTTESTMESTTESAMESTTESPMESTMESPTESTMESTEEKSDATFLAKPKQDNTRQSISKESVKKGSEAIREQPTKQTTDEGATVEQPTEQPTNEDAAVDQPTKREATVEQSPEVTSVVPLINENSKQLTGENSEQSIDKNGKQTTGKNGKQLTDKSSKQPTGKSSTQSADEDKPFVPPTIEMVRAYCREKGYHVDPEIFMAYYDSKGWVVGKGPMKSWPRAVAYWEHLDKKRAAEAKERQRRYRQHSYDTTADSYGTKGQGQTSSPAPVRKYHYE